MSRFIDWALFAGVLLLLFTTASFAGTVETAREAHRVRIAKWSAVLNFPRNNEEQKEAVRIIANTSDIKSLRDSSITPKLRSLLSDKDRGIRMDAMQSIAAREDAASISILKEMLDKDPDPDIRLHAIWAYARCDKQNAVPFLKRLLSDKDARRQLESASSLGGLGDKSGLPIAMQFINDDRAEIRNAAVMALRAIKDNSSVATIEKRLREGALRPSLAHEAIITIRLANTQSDSAKILYLTELSRNPDWAQRTAAVWCFRDLSDNLEAMKVLRGIALTKGHPAQREAIQAAITFGAMDPGEEITR